MSPDGPARGRCSFPYAHTIMAITKTKKGEILAKLEQAFAEATSVVFVRFNKLTVADVSAMRAELKKEGVQYFVAKKTLIKRALASRGHAGELPELPGEIAVAWGAGDSTLPARSIHGYVQKLKGALAIAGGVFDGAYADAPHMKEIATIPALPVLRGMFVNVINAPIQGVVIALSEIAKKKA